MTPRLITKLLLQDKLRRVAGGLIENVEELIDSDPDSPWSDILDSLLGAGYHVLAFKKLPMIDVGVPNTRARCIVLFWRAGPGQKAAVHYEG